MKQMKIVNQIMFTIKAKVCEKNKLEENKIELSNHIDQGIQCNITNNVPVSTSFSLIDLDIPSIETKIKQIVTILEQKLLIINKIIEEDRETSINIMSLIELKKEIYIIKNSINSLYLSVVQAKSSMDIFHFTMEAQFRKILYFVEYSFKLNFV